MTLKVTIDLDNSAFSFDDDGGPEDGIAGGELARIFRKLAFSYDHARVGPGTIPIIDINGNVVGESRIK